MPTIQVEVSAEVAGIIAAKVADGSYDSADAYITEAVYLLEEAHSQKSDDEKYNELRNILSIGSQQLRDGLGKPYSYAQLDADMKKRRG